jgi:hypothetical protein
LRSGKLVALVVVIVWFYVLLAALMNPVYTSPIVPTNPIMPFLKADTVDRLWPLILISSPFTILAGQQLLLSPGGRREVSAVEFARIQARAHKTRELTKEGVSRPGSHPPKSAQREAAEPQAAESTPLPKDVERKMIAAEELLRPTPKTSEPEFTPPPITPRGERATETPEAASVGEEMIEESSSKPSEMELQEEREADSTNRIEELEAERAAMASLMDRLEEMQKLGAIQPDLYDKLKKKYISELQRINAKVERLPVNEEFKKKASKK